MKITTPGFEPGTLTTEDGQVHEQQPLKLYVVKELLNVRQPNPDKYPFVDTASWLLSHAFFGNDKHTEEVEHAVAYRDLLDLHGNVLEFNALRKTGPEVAPPGESPAAETPAGT